MMFLQVGSVKLLCHSRFMPQACGPVVIRLISSPLALMQHKAAKRAM